MFVEFTSDESVTRQGFVATWQASPPTAEPTAAPTNVGATNAPVTPMPTGAPSFAWATCATSGTTYTTPTGTVSDGDGMYADGQACSWTISTGSAITIRFDEFSTERGYDYVKVYDGTSNSGAVLGSFHGSSVPSAVTARSGSMFVEFTSDGSVVNPGFVATWAAGRRSGVTSSGLGNMRAAERPETDGFHDGAEAVVTDGTFPYMIIIGVTAAVAALVVVGIIIVRQMTKKPVHKPAAPTFDFIRELQQCESEVGGGGYAPDLSASHSSFVSFASMRFSPDLSSSQHSFASMRLGHGPSPSQNSAPDDLRSSWEWPESAPDDSLSSLAVVA